MRDSDDYNAKVFARVVAKERAAELAELMAGEPLPARDILREETLRAVRALLADPESPPSARMAAAKLLLDATEPEPRKVLLALLNGDEAALEEWLVRELEACRKRRLEAGK